jgi:hypothetical protein
LQRDVYLRTNAIQPPPPADSDGCREMCIWEPTLYKHHHQKLLMVVGRCVFKNHCYTATTTGRFWWLQGDVYLRTIAIQPPPPDDSDGCREICI